jgi:hypothetical protein
LINILWHNIRMPDDIHAPGDQDYRPRPVNVSISTHGLAERLAQLPTRKEMYRAVLLDVTTGAVLVQCLAWIFR